MAAGRSENSFLQKDCSGEVQYSKDYIGIVPTVFNGIPDVMLVMLEKRV